jgi:hypothetical protein
MKTIHSTIAALAVVPLLALAQPGPGGGMRHLGPTWFIDNQELQLKANDRVTVTGSRVLVNGKPTLIATEVKRGNDTLKLREPDGTPRWVAWRQVPPAVR